MESSFSTVTQKLQSSGFQIEHQRLTLLLLAFNRILQMGMVTTARSVVLEPTNIRGTFTLSILHYIGIFGGDVPPASPNPDPISDQKMPFPPPVFRPGLKSPYPFSDLTLYVIKHSICISAERNST